MLISVTQDARHRRLIVGCVALVLFLASFLMYTVLEHRSATPRTTVAADQRLGPEADKPIAKASPDQLSALGPTTDPEAFVRLAATALFEWDTVTLTSRVQRIERLVKVADPTGESSAGLVADIENYLPTSLAWAQLQQYETRQWIEITSTRVPTTWSKAEAQAGADGLLPGTTAYTVSGVRHRSGVWEAKAVTSAHWVTFTVFVVCGPTYPECHLLRLSLLDEPLD